MTVENYKKLIELVKINEGFEPQIKPCPAGHPTIGYGHNLDANPFSKAELDYLRINGRDFENEPMTLIEADWLLERDLTNAFHAVQENFISKYELSEVVQVVLVDMVFNMGLHAVLGFKYFLAALVRDDMVAAVHELMTSRWFSQVGDRGLRLCVMLKKDSFLSGAQLQDVRFLKQMMVGI